MNRASINTSNSVKIIEKCGIAPGIRIVPIVGLPATYIHAEQSLYCGSDFSNWRTWPANVLLKLSLHTFALVHATELVILPQHDTIIGTLQVIGYYHLRSQRG